MVVARCCSAARDLAGLHQLDDAVLVVDRNHRLEILGSHASEQVLQGDLIHGQVHALDGPPEAAIPEPLPRLDSVGVAGCRIRHELEHEGRDRLAVLAHELSNPTR